MSFSIDFSNKVILVTGVSSGIGVGIAHSFAQAGAIVVGCSRKPSSDKSIIHFHKLVQLAGGTPYYIQTDVTKPEELIRYVEKAVSHFGGIDVLVSNAGVNIFKGAEKCTENDWQHNLDLNLSSHWRLAKAAKPYLEKSSCGVVLLMTSNHAYSSMPGCFPYNIAKTAITGLVRSLAIEWGPKIRAIGVAPGFIDTPGNDSWFNSFPNPEHERQLVIGLHPVKRIGTVEQVGDLCLFLASSKASFINGTTILMDGGRSALMQDD